MNCPVCSTMVEDDASMCPHCQSDLEVFQLIVKANQQRQTSRKLISALGVFAAVTAIGWASVGIFSGKGPETAPVEVSPEVKLQGEVRSPADSELIAMLTNENTALKSENASLNAKLSTPVKKEAKEVKDVKDVKVAKETKETKALAKVTAPEEKGTLIHTVREGDTFWIISRKYFGTGTKFKQIAKDNGMTEKTRLHKGMKIKIVKA